MAPGRAPLLSASVMTLVAGPAPGPVTATNQGASDRTKAVVELASHGHLSWRHRVCTAHTRDDHPWEATPGIGGKIEREAGLKASRPGQGQKGLSHRQRKTEVGRAEGEQGPARRGKVTRRVKRSPPGTEGAVPEKAKDNPLGQRGLPQKEKDSPKEVQWRRTVGKCTELATQVRALPREWPRRDDRRKTSSDHERGSRGERTVLLHASPAG